MKTGIKDGISNIRETIKENVKKENVRLPSVEKAWRKYFTDEMWNVELPETSIYDFMYSNNKDYPNDVAMNYLGRKITYKELFENIDVTAKAFVELGVRSGDIVTVALPSTPEALYVTYALNKLGAAANMIHPLAGKEELVFYLNEVKSKIAVLFDGTYKILGDALKKTKVEHAVIVSAGESLPMGMKQLFFLKNKRISLPSEQVTIWWSHFLSNGKNAVIPNIKKDKDTLAIISHTGGTTGEPKGVMCSDYNINSLIVQMGSMLSMKRQEPQIVVLPPFVNYSLVNSMLEPIALGMVCALIPKYEPDKFFEYAKKYKPAFVASIPPYWEALLKVEKKDRCDLSFMRCAAYGGEAMDPNNEDAVNVVFKECNVPFKLGRGIGMTELCGASTFTPYGPEMGKSLGVPVQKVGCKIIDPETYRELPYNTDGEICFSGPTLMMGYYHNKKATDDVVKIHADGERWIHTGDLGHLDEDGRLYITGRIKRIIMTKGPDGNVTKLFPDRIEKAVNQHPSVDLSCVISVPDEVRVNYPKAFVELKPGVAATKELAEEIKKNCHNFLPIYMIPEEVEFVGKLPRTSRGKVDFRALEKMESEKN